MPARSTRDATSSALRPDVHPFVEAEIDVVDVRHPFAERRHQIEIGLQSVRELFVTDTEKRRIALEQDDPSAVLRSLERSSGDCLAFVAEPGQVPEVASITLARSASSIADRFSPRTK